MTTDLKTRLTSYLSFADELSSLLHSSGITPARLSIRGNSNPEKNRLTPQMKQRDQQVGRVIIYMEKHLSDDLNLDKLAERVSLSKYQLIRRFRDEQGTTPWKFLMQKRVDHVKELLEDGISPCQAAVEAGFYDQSHLNKVFREYTGQTPKEYQEENFNNRN